MENVSVKSPTATSESSATYTGALAVLTTLFFMWGSLTSLNDVLIPYVQHVFKIELAASMLIQTAFFSAYFVFSIPAAKIIDWIGYVAVLGKPQTASSRLNLTQAFNSLGTTIFPWIGAHLILRTTATAMAQSASQAADAVIKLYVYFFAAALALLAIGIGLSKLPKMESAEHHIGEKINDSIWKHPNLIFGAIGIFVYVGGEVAIGSSISNYLALDNIGGFISPFSVPDAATRYRAALGEAAKYISLYWLGAMIGRFIGSALLQKIKPGKLLAFAAIMATLLVTTSVLTNGHVAMWTILSVGLFNSIMFPCIFTMGIAELGPLTGDGSGLLNMAIVGGAIIPWIVGKAGDLINHRYYAAMIQGETSWGQGIHYALIAAAACYLYILFFALSGSKPNSERNAKS